MSNFFKPNHGIGAIGRKGLPWSLLVDNSGRKGVFRISLTHVRSKPWIEQMFARAVRINKHAGAWADQIAYIFAPDDILIREIVHDIEDEQVRGANGSSAKKLILTNGEKEQRPKIVPLGSAATNQREATLEATPKTPGWSFQERFHLTASTPFAQANFGALSERLHTRQGCTLTACFHRITATGRWVQAKAQCLR